MIWPVFGWGGRSSWTGPVGTARAGGMMLRSTQWCLGCVAGEGAKEFLAVEQQLFAFVVEGSEEALNFIPLRTARNLLNQMCPFSPPEAAVHVPRLAV